MRSMNVFVMSIGIALTMPGVVLAGGEHAGHAKPTAGAADAAGDMVEGEVRKVDKAAGKVTLKHGEIKKYEMPGMTMVFQVKDPAMLDAVKEGDKVRFSTEKSGSTFVITEMAPAK